MLGEMDMVNILALRMRHGSILAVREQDDPRYGYYRSEPCQKRLFERKVHTR
jgi:hypothetical protein